jgi:hypothetical protein
MRDAILLGALMCLLLALACQTLPSPALIRQRIDDTKSWHLNASTRYEPSGAPVLSQSSERRFKPADWYAWLIRSTSSILKNKYGIVLTEDTSATSGELCFVVTELFDGRIGKIELTLDDAGKQSIMRLTIFVPAELPTHPWPIRADAKDDDLAGYIAGKTAAVLRGTSTVIR